MMYFASGKPMEWRIGSRTFRLRREPLGPLIAGRRRFLVGPFRVARFAWRHTPAATFPPYETVRTACTTALACAHTSALLTADVFLLLRADAVHAWR
jgi:hypothetical protein